MIYSTRDKKMCGIAGIISTKGIKTKDLPEMSSMLQHRGPNGHGYLHYSQRMGMRVWLNQEPPPQDPGSISVGFAHRRLSIIDLSMGSSQPMIDGSGKYGITFNGEIYNYLELKQELEKLGYSFKTTGDTEVLLRAYEAWGPACMKRLNGMWAFVLLDAQNQCVIFSKDRFGIKPLYYMIQDNSIYFSSEIKGLLALSSYRPEPNEKIIFRYLLTGIVDDTEETFFQGTFGFPPGHWAKVSLTSESLSMKPEPYWTFPQTSYQGTEEDAVNQFRELFLDSLKIHTQSDVPVGTCLSGGLDSSSIVCGSELLRKNYQLPNLSHSAFGYCTSDERYLEKKYMETVAQATSIKMHYVEFTAEQFRSFLPQIIRSQEEPFGSASIVTQWFVFQRAKAEGMTVMLDGQGADETLAGYHTYFATIALDLLSKRKFLRYLSLRSQYEREIGTFPLSRSLYSLGTLSSFIPYPLQTLLRPVIQLLRQAKQKGSFVQRGRSSVNASMMKQFSMNQMNVFPIHSLNEELQIQVRSTCLPALLRYEDRNSMDHSIEARVPFLDHRLVEFLFTLPEHWKIHGVTTKYILREAMKGILPESIRTRKDKIGFKATPDLTFHLVRDHFDSLVESQTEYEKKWFDSEGVKETLLNPNQSVHFEFLLWRILNLKLWLRQNWN
jgi:asparagine synthase (glutamine-hydrolysing)